MLVRKDKVLAELRALEGGNGDCEYSHVEADRLLCEFLESLGHQDVVEAFGKVDKWYY
jgi:hypothetical protein